MTITSTSSEVSWRKAGKRRDVSDDEKTRVGDVEPIDCGADGRGLLANGAARAGHPSLRCAAMPTQQLQEHQDKSSMNTGPRKRSRTVTER
jgi:hypothetical protein